MVRHTIIVHNRNARRTHRTQAAINAQQGLQLYIMEQLAARLAGGFLQPIDDDALNVALAAALVTPLGDLDAIKELPGFRRAAAATLTQAWRAGLDLTAEMAAASTGMAAARLGSLATLEREVLTQLPVRLEFPILSLNPGLRQCCVAPNVWSQAASAERSLVPREDVGVCWSRR